jgi:hypothetical protein
MNSGAIAAKLTEIQTLQDSIGIKSLILIIVKQYF